MSKELRKLLKQNRTLEEKIFYDTRETDWRSDLISSHELSQALDTLSSRIVKNTETELSILYMLNDVKEIAYRPLAAFEKNALQVVELTFNYLRIHTEFSSKLSHILNSLQLAFTRLSLNDLSYLDNPKHIAIRLLEKLLSLSTHVDSSAGNMANNLLQAIEILIDRLANQKNVSAETFEKANQKLDEYLTAFDNKVATNINLILASIDNKSKAEQANQYTEQLINSKTQGEEMPIFLLDFFENLIKPILHKIISNHGVKSKQCQQLITDMDALTWSITCAQGDPNYKVRYEADVTFAMKRLYQHFIDNDSLTDYIKSLFIEIEDYHNKKLRGERVEYDVMISANIFADEDYENDDIVHWYDHNENNVFFDFSSLKEDEWYLLQDEEKKYRCRLLRINHLTRELFFVNVSGKLVVTINFSDSEYLSKNLSHIESEHSVSFKNALESLSRELASRSDFLKEQYSQLLNQRARDKKEQRKQEEMNRKVIQAKIEAEKQLQIKKKQRELEESKRLEELDAKRCFHIKSIYRKLKPGVLAAVQSDSGKWLETTFSFYSKTTGKHIFTNSQHDKVIEPSKQELFDLISENKIKILKEAPLNDKLSFAIKQRRNKLSER